MSTTDQSHQDELRALKELYDKVGLRGYWDIGRTASRPPPIEPRIWHWRDVYPALQRSAEVIRLGEDTFRRANGMDTGSRTLIAGFQYVAPGESAGAHRHRASALRFVVQGHGGYTTSDGVQMMMEPGDLLTQPNWTWHDHNNFGNEPMIWLDGLDSTLVQYLDANFHENWQGETQPLIGSSDETQQRLSPVRAPAVTKMTRRVPYHYRWTDTLRALTAEAAASDPHPHDGYLLEYRDPIGGGHTFTTISCRVQMLLPGQSTKFHRHTSTTIYHAVGGEGMIRIDKKDPVEFSWGEKDTFILPPWRWHQHINTSRSEPAILFSESDLPVLEALDLYREELD
jgi:gentisate 1,2-dioxygenase